MLVRFFNSCAPFYKAMTIFPHKILHRGTKNITVSESRTETHHAVQLYPVNLIAGADSGLLGLQSVWEGANLEHQQIESFQNFSAINDSISQSMTRFTM